MKPILLIALVLSAFIVKGQEKQDEHVVQFTGVVVEGDSLKPMPFTHITIKNSRMGTISDYYGFFSFVAHTNDTILFSSVGYERNKFVIPDSLEEKSYSIIHMMVKDTMLLKEFTVFPWPTREQFKQAFLTVEIPDDDLERAKKNLSRESMMAVAGKVPIDGSTTYKYALQNRYTQLYQAGGYPSLKLLDPIAWSKFIKAWQDGDFKEKRNVKYTPE
ncbi:MAG: carboxypeptidase-like regulatory domain-containing protein [Vicingus serpentipes]|nr:carboxypeptidase-like regulatory domain-containing protein [Vicingus serpentipes]